MQETLDTLVQDFFVYLEAERGYSPLTVTAYRSDLSQLFDFMQQTGQDLAAEAVTTQAVRRWIVDLRQRGLSSNSVARHIYSLKSFWGYLLNCEIVDRDPLRSIAPPYGLICWVGGVGQAGWKQWRCGGGEPGGRSPHHTARSSGTPAGPAPRAS